ncbi:hypothetical protein BJX96DRAFT_152065 [Aspergillus floccosus]
MPSYPLNRYPRATVIQLECSGVQKSMFNPDWDMVRKDPSNLSLPTPDWILTHDCEESTYRAFNAVVQSIQEKREYMPTNILPAGAYVR